jgi:hypothetical protein
MSQDAKQRWVERIKHVVHSSMTNAFHHRPFKSGQWKTETDGDSRNVSACASVGLLIEGSRRVKPTKAGPLVITPTLAFSQEPIVSPHLSLYEDIYSNGASATLPPAPRMIFVVYGEILISDRSLGEGETWHDVGAALVRAGDAGASVWRWDLTEGPSLSLASEGVRSLAKISAALERLPKGDLLMRGDSVAFPPGGRALTHVHQGPGIRCLVEGGIRIDTQGRSTAYGPGGAWFEAGPDAVFAQAALDRPTRFIRGMILPAALLGKNSILYVNAADRDRPHAQSYERFVDAPIAFTLSPR